MDPRVVHAREGSGNTRRGVFTAAAFLPVLGILLASSVMATRERAARELARWILPNARVLVTPGDDSCPLHPHDQIRNVAVAGRAPVSVSNAREVRAMPPGAGPSLHVAVARNRREHWVEVPVVEVTAAERLARHAAAALVAGASLWIPPSVSRGRQIPRRVVQELMAELESSATSIREQHNAVERNALLRALREAGGNVTHAADLLGRSRGAVYRLLRKHGVALVRPS